MIWQLEDVTRNQVDDLVSMRVVQLSPHAWVPPKNVKIVTPVDWKLADGHALTFQGMLFGCGVCKKSSSVPDFQIGVSESLWMEPDINNEQPYTCPHCGSHYKILGIQSETEDQSPRYWVVIQRITQPTFYPANLIQESHLDAGTFSVEPYREDKRMTKTHAKEAGVPEAQLTDTHRQAVALAKLFLYWSYGRPCGFPDEAWTAFFLPECTFTRTDEGLRLNMPDYYLRLRHFSTSAVEQAFDYMLAEWHTPVRLVEGVRDLLIPYALNRIPPTPDVYKDITKLIT